ncbi:MAG: polysulfide reductase NrfD [bacterium]|nr:polysulfide reductase NrfD [bacterium]
MAKSNRLLKDVLWILALWGLVAGGFRLWFGLGATTNLTDAVPWGLWKILNMIAGVALSTSGFTVGFLVYVLRRKRFLPLMRMAILVAFLGYGCSCLALLFDIGLPHRFWHPFVMWNEHSFLFEVFWCVILYFTVTTIEVVPTILERTRAERIGKFLHGIAFGVVVFGISLSSLHHSSLGSLFLVTPERLHELWYSELLPVFFILSAMGGGMMVLVLLRILVARWYDPEPIFGATPAPVEGAESTVPGFPTLNRNVRGAGREMPMLANLATISAFILGGYFVLKVVDLVRTGAWQFLAGHGWPGPLYAVELLGGVLLPVVLVACRPVRRSPLGLGVAAFCAAAGLALNRLNVGIFGYWPGAETTYVPSLAEWSVGLGVIAAAGLAFLVVVENFAILERKNQPVGAGVFRAAFDAFSHVYRNALNSGLHRVSLIAVIMLPLAWVAMHPSYRDVTGGGRPVQPSQGVDVARAVLRIDGDRTGLSVDFNHADHQRRLGGDQACVTCHHLAVPGDKTTPCSRCHRDMVDPTGIFDHRHHLTAVAAKAGGHGALAGNGTCTECHQEGAARSAVLVKDCRSCHEKDGWPALAGADPTVDLAVATSFQTAMHAVCVECHKNEAVRVAKPGLGDCGACHADLRRREDSLFAVVAPSRD